MQNKEVEVNYLNGGVKTKQLEDEFVQMFFKGIFEILTKEKILQIAGVKKPKDILENKT